ncbi:MAG: hypothetical protein IKR48_06270 [Kiritimatiellae bacterium]|nr:hypothetical protein [Kiritimatiellia bacterium]
MTKFLWAIPIYVFCSRGGRKLLSIVFLSCTCFYFLHRLEPAKYQLSPIQRNVAENLVQQAVEQFPWSRDGVGRVLMVSDSDSWDYFQDAIRRKVAEFGPDRSRRFDILPDHVLKRIGKTIGVGQTMSPLTIDKIDSIRQKMDADTLLVVHFDGTDYTENETTAQGRLTCTFYSRQNLPPKTVIANYTHEKTSQLLNQVGYVTKSYPFAMRLLCAILGVLLFPFLMLPITITVIRKQSSRLNAWMVLIYILILFAFEWAIWGTPTNVIEAMMLCLWGVLIIWYLLAVSNYLASYCSSRG